MTVGLIRAQEEIDNVIVNSAPLEGELETAPPLTDISTTAYFHGPMPDRAIKQHFLTKKTTSAVIDGSGKDQVLLRHCPSPAPSIRPPLWLLAGLSSPRFPAARQRPYSSMRPAFAHASLTGADLSVLCATPQTLDVPADSAEPGFYYLRDSDGSRKTLEVRDASLPEPVPANKSVGGMPMPYEKSIAAVPFSGLTSTYQRVMKDPQVGGAPCVGKTAAIGIAHTDASCWGWRQRPA